MTSSSQADTPSENTFRSASEWVSLAMAVVFVAIGVIGFAVTGFSDFAASHTDEHVLIFEVNPLHNTVHLALGLVGLALWWRARSALVYGVILLVGYGAAFVYGLFALDKDWDFLSLNAEDNWLHAGLAAIGGLIAYLAYRGLSEPEPATARRRRRPAGGGGRTAPA